jgi:hypothetical protein
MIIAARAHATFSDRLNILKEITRGFPVFAQAVIRPWILPFRLTRSSSLQTLRAVLL